MQPYYRNGTVLFFLGALAISIYLSTRNIVYTIACMMIIGVLMHWGIKKIIYSPQPTSPRLTTLHLVQGAQVPLFLQDKTDTKNSISGLWYEKGISSAYLLWRPDGIEFFCEEVVFLPFHTELHLEYATPRPNTFFVDVKFAPIYFPQSSKGNLKNTYELYHHRLPVFSECSEQSMSLVKRLAQEAGIPCEEVVYQEI